MESLLLAALLLVLGQTQTGVLTGRVLSVEGTPMAGVRVVAVEEGGNASTMESLSQTDSNGRYRLENLRPGRYYIAVGALGDLSYYPGTGALADAKAIAATASGIVTVPDFSFNSGSGIVKSSRAASVVSGVYSGIVRDTQNVPMQNVTILMTDPGTDKRFMTNTNASGEFQFSGLPVGSLSMETLSPANGGFQKAGFEHLRSVVVLRPGESLRHEIRLRMVMAAVSARVRPDLYVSPEREVRPQGSATRIGSGTGEIRTAPKRPAYLAYPPGMQVAGETAVTLQALVSTEGRVMFVRAVSPEDNPELVRLAIAEVSQWTFSKMILPNADAVEYFGTVSVVFGR